MLLHEKAMDRPSGEIAGAPNTRTSWPVHNSVPFPLESFQMLSLVPLEVTYNWYAELTRGANPLLVLNETRTGAAASLPGSEICKRHKDRLGLATVSTSR